MDAYKLAVKSFIENPSAIKLEEFVPVFHRWIQNQLLPDHLLIDVGDYKHVHEGPGIVLVGHQANLYADEGDGRLGLMYVRKQPLPGSFHERLRAVFQHALAACSLLEDEASLPVRVKFRTDESVFRVNDRLLAPNEPSTFEQIKDDLQRFVQTLYQTDGIRLRYQPHAERLFEVIVCAPQSTPIATLRERVPSS